MRRTLWILVAVSAAAWSTPRPGPPSCKPVAPIDLEARLEGDPSAGFRIVASASGRGRDVELEVVLPDGVTAPAIGRKASGKRPEVRLDARGADGGTRREVLVRATLREGDAVLTRVRSLVLHDAPVSSRGVPRTGARGEPILEFGP